MLDPWLGDLLRLICEACPAMGLWKESYLVAEAVELSENLFLELVERILGLLDSLFCLVELLESFIFHTNLNGGKLLRNLLDASAVG